MESGDPKGALDLMRKIVLLQMARGLTLPDEFPLNGTSLLKINNTSMIPVS